MRCIYLFTIYMHFSVKNIFLYDSTTKVLPRLSRQNKLREVSRTMVFFRTHEKLVNSKFSNVWNPRSSKRFTSVNYERVNVVIRIFVAIIIGGLAWQSHVGTQRARRMSFASFPRYINSPPHERLVTRMRSSTRSRIYRTALRGVPSIR